MTTWEPCRHAVWIGSAGAAGIANDGTFSAFESRFYARFVRSDAADSSPCLLKRRNIWALGPRGSRLVTPEVRSYRAIDIGR